MDNYRGYLYNQFSQTKKSNRNIFDDYSEGTHLELISTEPKNVVNTNAEITDYSEETEEQQKIAELEFKNSALITYQHKQIIYQIQTVIDSSKTQWCTTEAITKAIYNKHDRVLITDVTHFLNEQLLLQPKKKVL